MLHFAGDKALWPTFKNRIQAYLVTQKLLEVLLYAGQAEATSAAAATKAAAAAAAAVAAPNGGATSSSTPPAATPTPTQAAVPTEEQQELWAERSARVYAILVMCVQCPSLAMKINNVKFGDAHAVWKVLLARFENHSMHNLMQATDQLHQLKLDESEAAPLDMFVARIRSLELALTELGQAPDEMKLKIVLLRGLPSSYESAMKVLRMQGNLSFDEMVTQLETEEREMQAKRKSEIDEVASLARENRHQQQRFGDRRSSHRGGGAGSSSQHSRGGGNNSQQRLCYGCNQPGHVAFDCPKNRDAIKCSLCRTLGHSDKQCQSTRRGRGAGANHRRKQQRDDDEDANLAADSNDDDVEGYGFVIFETACATSTGLKPSSFVFDSACTINLSNNKDQMQKVRRLSKPIRLKVANNKIMLLHHVGEIVLKLPGDIPLTLHNVAYHPALATNLVSMARIADAGFVTLFGDDYATVHVKPAKKDDPLGPPVCEATRQGKLYVLKLHGDDEPATTSESNKQQDGSGAGGEPTVVQTALQVTQAPAVPASQSPAAAPSGPASSSSSSSSTPEVPENPTELWHMRLGHVAKQRLHRLSHAGALAGLPKLTQEAWEGIATALEKVCGSCAKGKQHRHAFKKTKPESARATVPGESMCGDLAGPILVKKSVNEQQELVPSLNGNHYASTLIDEATGKIFVDALPKKSDAAGALIVRLKRIQQSGKHVVKFHTDGGGEYVVKKLQEYFHLHGIEHTTTQAHTPQHNGIAERVNRTLFEMARCMLQHAKLGSEFWVRAVSTAAYLINRTRTVDWTRAGAGAGAGGRLVTSEEAWSGVRPSVKHVRVFGSDCFVHVPDAGRGKLDAKAQPAIFVGYPESKPGWLVLLMSTGKIIESRDVTFNENQFTFRGEALNSALGRPGAYADETSIGQILDNIQFEQDLKEALQISKQDQAADKKKAEERKAAVVPGVGESKADSSSAASGSEAGLRLLSAASSASSVPASSVSVVSASVHAPAAAAAAAAAAPASAAGVPPRAPAASSKKKSKAPAAPAAGTRSSARLSAMEPKDYSYPDSASFAWESDASDPELDLEEAAQEQQEHAFEARESAPTDPTSYADAMSRPAAERAEWIAAMQAELEAHRINGTWRLVPLPRGRRAIGCKWVLKTKYTAAGAIERRKARIVAKGFAQRAGVDYHETFAPTLKYVSFRLMLILAAAFDLELKQMDVISTPSWTRRCT